jgi:hypothetical protein
MLAVSKHIVLSFIQLRPAPVDKTISRALFNRRTTTAARCTLSESVRNVPALAHDTRYVQGTHCLFIHDDR